MYIKQGYKHYEKYDIVRFLNPQEISKVITKAMKEEDKEYSEMYQYVLFNLSGQLAVIGDSINTGYTMIGNNPNFYTHGFISEYDDKWVFSSDFFELAK